MSDKATSFRASNLKDWELAAAASLKKLFKEQATLSQKDFGERYAIGTAGMVSQYLNAKRPLRLTTAIKFAKGLGVTVADISLTLAGQLPYSESQISELGAVVSRLTSSGKMHPAEVDAMIAMLKAREGTEPK